MYVHIAHNFKVSIQGFFFVLLLSLHFTSSYFIVEFIVSPCLCILNACMVHHTQNQHYCQCLRSHIGNNNIGWKYEFTFAPNNRMPILGDVRAVQQEVSTSSCFLETLRVALNECSMWTFKRQNIPAVFPWNFH